MDGEAVTPLVPFIAVMVPKETDLALSGLSEDSDAVSMCHGRNLTLRSASIGCIPWLERSTGRIGITFAEQGGAFLVDSLRSRMFVLWEQLQWEVPSSASSSQNVRCSRRSLWSTAPCYSKMLMHSSPSSWCIRICPCAANSQRTRRCVPVRLDNQHPTCSSIVLH